MSDTPFEDLNHVHPCALHIERTSFDSPEAAEAWLTDGAREGWLCYTDAVGPWRPGQDVPHEGTLLQGEVAVSDTESRHLRFESGAWLGWSYSETAGTSNLRAEQSLISSEPEKSPFKRLVYHTYYAAQPIDELTVWEPHAARFFAWETA